MKILPRSVVENIAMDAAAAGKDAVHTFIRCHLSLIFLAVKLEITNPTNKLNSTAVDENPASFSR